MLKIIVANKSDLNEHRKISTEQGKELADKYGIPFLETSAKDNNKISDLFEQASLDYIEKLENTTNIGNNTNTNDEKQKILLNNYNSKSDDNDIRITNLTRVAKKNSLLIHVEKRDDSNCCK